MPDKIWRKKLHSKQSKDISTQTKVGSVQDAIPDEPNDRYRPHNWRVVSQTTRPETPLNANEVPNTPVTEDVDDAQNEHSEHSMPRPSTKPKLARYTSLFTSFKESTKGPDFAEPWGENAPQTFQPYVDPLNALQAIRSSMTIASSTPIPLEFHSSLFRIFEDYRKVRDEKDVLEAMAQDLLRDWGEAEEHWKDSELRYNAEIRRLDLLIARGTGGMTRWVLSSLLRVRSLPLHRLFQARQDSIVDRKRLDKRTMSTNNLVPTDSFLSPKQLEEAIKMKAHQGM